MVVDESVPRDQRFIPSRVPNVAREAYCACNAALAAHETRLVDGHIIAGGCAVTGCRRWDFAGFRLKEAQ